MSLLPTNPRQATPSFDAPASLTPKQANIYVWGWQPNARFRDAVCGRRFGKTFLGKAEMRRAARLAVKWGVSVEDEIWYAAPTQKQARRGASNRPTGSPASRGKACSDDLVQYVLRLAGRSVLLEGP